MLFHYCRIVISFYYRILKVDNSNHAELDNAEERIMKFLTSIVLLCLTVAAHASDRFYLHRYQQSINYPYSVSQGGSVLDALQLGENNSLEILAKHPGPKGKTITRFQQKYKGIPVYGEHAIVSYDKDGFITSLYGHAIKNIRLKNIIPKIKKVQALDLMKSVSEQTRSSTRRSRACT